MQVTRRSQFTGNYNTMASMDSEYIEPNTVGGTLAHYGTSYIVTGNDTVDDSGTLPDGVFVGQLKTITLMTDGGDDFPLTITNAGGGLSPVDYDAAGDTAVYIWDGSDWRLNDGNVTVYP